MATNSQEENSSSEESFGWVDMEDNKFLQVKRAGDGNADGMSSDSEDDSDDTYFEAEYNSEIAVNPLQDQRVGLKGNDSSVVNLAPWPTKEDPSEEPDVSRDETLLGSSLGSLHHEDEDSAKEDKKVLTPFTKKLIVKKERFSHTVSDDDNDNPPARRSLRVESYSNSPAQERRNISKSAVLIEGALKDLSQTLPFDIDPNEDVWILQCPHEIPESTLKDKTLSFNGVSCIDNFESKLLITPEIQPLNLLLPKLPGKIIKIVPEGHIILKEKETSLQAIQPLHSEEVIISPPVGLKLRHPLFGTELPLMGRPVAPSQPKKKKKKIKKHGTHLENEFSGTENGVVGPENTIDFRNELSPSLVHMKVKKKKKHADKHSLDNIYQYGNDSQSVAESSFSTDSRPKSKTKRYETNSYVDINHLSEMQNKHSKFKCESEESLLQDKKSKDLAYSSKVGKHMLLRDSDGINNISAQKMKTYSNEIVDRHNMSGSLVETTQELVAVTPKKKTKKHKYEYELETKYAEPAVKQAPDEVDEYFSTSLLTQRLNESADDALADSSSDVLKKKKKKKIKQDYSEIAYFSSESPEGDSFDPSYKKSKKVKLEHSGGHFEHTGSGTVFTNARKVENKTPASLHSFDHDMEDVSIKKRKKYVDRVHSYLSQSVEDKSPDSKSFTQMFNESDLKQEPEYLNDTTLTEMQYKKKKKKKKKSE